MYAPGPLKPKANRLQHEKNKKKKEEKKGHARWRLIVRRKNEATWRFRVHNDGDW